MVAASQEQGYPSVERTLTEPDIINLTLFLNLALATDARFTLEFDTGRHFSGVHGFDEAGKPLSPEDIGPEHIIQGPQGFRMEVGLTTLRDEKTGEERLYPTIGAAALAGLHILTHLIPDISETEE